jgi:DNA primase
MIPPAFIQDLLARVDIVDVIDASVKLKRAGANHVACCPFHSEKSPSFTVSQTKQFYHCFGCGAHGTAIGFLMEYHGLGFVETVKELAQRVGMTVPEPQRRDDGRMVDPGPPRGVIAGLKDVLREAALFYKAQLKSSTSAIDYLRGRGVSGEIAARFGIGWAPPGWQALQAVFPDHASNDALVDCGLVIRGDDGRRHDRFRERVMFPIVDARGEIVGFGGRVLDGGQPKYLNSPETPVFQKGHELYGLYQARAAIRAEDRVIVVEGYMDVVALAQHGVANAVATLGTSTTATHVTKLLRLADEVTFCFDGDGAGRKAAWRALETALPALVDGKRVSFLFLPDGHDPDSFVREQGKDAFDALVRRAEPLSAWLLRGLQEGLEMDTPEGKAAFLKAAERLLGTVQARNFGLAMRDAVARAGGVGVEDLQVTPSALGSSGRPRGTLRPALATREQTELLREKHVLLALALLPDRHATVAELASYCGASPFWGRIARLCEWLGDQASQGRDVTVMEFDERLAAEGERESVRRWLREALLDPDDIQANLHKYLAHARQSHQASRTQAELAGVKSPSDLTPDQRHRLLMSLQRG